MIDIDSSELAYQALANEVFSFIGHRQWTSAGALHKIYSSMVSTEWWLANGDVRTEKGDFPLSELSRAATMAVRFLRDNLLATTGDRIWGLTFTLYPDGKFNIEYDYNKPECYEETDETIEVNLPSLQR